MRSELIDNGLESFLTNDSFNNRFLRKRGMESTPEMKYQVFLFIFQKNSAMATLGLKETETANRADIFPTFPKEFSHFLQT